MKMQIYFIIFVIITVFFGCKNLHKNRNIENNKNINNFTSMPIQKTKIENLVKDFEEKYVSFWADSFPVSSGTNGYVFFPNYDFVYTNLIFNEENIKKKYAGALGKWKIENNLIYLLKEYDFYFEKDLIIINKYKFEIGKDNPLKAIKNDNNQWEIIGKISSYIDTTFDTLMIET
jgi:hypothetical protein